MLITAVWSVKKPIVYDYFKRLESGQRTLENEKPDGWPAVNFDLSKKSKILDNQIVIVYTFKL